MQSLPLSVGYVMIGLRRLHISSQTCVAGDSLPSHIHQASQVFVVLLRLGWDTLIIVSWLELAKSQVRHHCHDEFRDENNTME
jgi:uncharacterized membrane protein